MCKGWVSCTKGIKQTSIGCHQTSSKFITLRLKAEAFLTFISDFAIEDLNTELQSFVYHTPNNDIEIEDVYTEI